MLKYIKAITLVLVCMGLVVRVWLTNRSQSVQDVIAVPKIEVSPSVENLVEESEEDL